MRVYKIRNMITGQFRRKGGYDHFDSEGHDYKELRNAKSALTRAKNKDAKYTAMYPNRHESSKMPSCEIVVFEKTYVEIEIVGGEWSKEF